MSVQVKRRRDTAANVAAFTGAEGELIVDLTNNRVVVQDGVTQGGWAAAKLSEVVTASRSTVSDVNYAALVTDRTIAFTAITAARTVNLPPASSFPTGVGLLVLDESGAASSARSISIGASGADLIDGASSAAISSAYGYVMLQSNGASSPNGKWTVVDQASSGLAAVGIGTAADPNNPLSVYGASALFNGANFNFTINKSAAANTASIIFEDNYSGRAQVGLAGDDNFHFKVSANGASWLDAVDINAATGQVSFNYGIACGDAPGFRNRLRNAQFAVNQRGVAGTVTLVAGAYGHDGVKAGATGATYTFASSGIDVVLTVITGSLILPIESALIEGGSYMLSQSGTAPARVWQGTSYLGSGSYASAPLSATGLAAAVQTNVEFSTGTVLRPQFEPGVVSTAFERRPPGVELSLCKRYYFQVSAGSVAALFGGGFCSTASQASFLIAIPEMRTNPALSGSSASTFWIASPGGAAATSYSSANYTNAGVRIDFNISGATLTSQAAAALSANNTTAAYLGFSAEL